MLKMSLFDVCDTNSVNKVMKALHTYIHLLYCLSANINSNNDISHLCMHYECIQSEKRARFYLY